MLLWVGLLVLPAFDAFAQPAQKGSGTAGDVDRVLQWVRSRGNASTLAAQWLPVLGIGEESLGNLPSRNKSYSVPEDSNATYAFSIVTFEGRDILLVARFMPNEMVSWRIDNAGTPLVTIYRDADDKMRTVPSGTYAALLTRVLARLAQISTEGH
jgi:hypothetical protein